MEELVTSVLHQLYTEQSPIMWTIMFHLLRHMKEQLAEWGPVRETWMFAYESFFGFLKSFVRNRSTPVQTILQARSLAKAVKTTTRLMERARTRIHGGPIPLVPVPHFVRDIHAPKAVELMAKQIRNRPRVRKLMARLKTWMKQAYAPELAELERMYTAAKARVRYAG
jgi:hypothetical protein